MTHRSLYYKTAIRVPEETNATEVDLRHLIIVAHPRIKSFNHSVVDAYTAALEERGHRVECRDLYAMSFNPVLSARDIAAIARGKPTRDIRNELNAIRAAEAVTLISPLWWGDFPAMLKGYIDRVFTAGSAYLNKDHRLSFSGKRGVIIMTSEASVDELKSSGNIPENTRRRIAAIVISRLNSPRISGGK